MVGEGEVDGLGEGEEVHFSRVISIAGASSYRLNGKEVGSALVKRSSSCRIHRGGVAVAVETTAAVPQ